MLRTIGLVLIGIGICTFVAPGALPIVSDFGPTAVHAGGVGAALLGVFLWWPSRD